MTIAVGTPGLTEIAGISTTPRLPSRSVSQRKGTVLRVAQLSAGMVRLFYTCPETGVIIVGSQMSEDTVVRAYDFPAAVQCPACEEIHHPKVRECQMVRSTLPRYAGPRLVT